MPALAAPRGLHRPAETACEILGTEGHRSVAMVTTQLARRRLKR
jgi:hypothetical protein